MVVDVEKKKEKKKAGFIIAFFSYKEDEETIIGGCHRAGSANQIGADNKFRPRIKRGSDSISP